MSAAAAIASIPSILSTVSIPSIISTVSIPSILSTVSIAAILYLVCSVQAMSSRICLVMFWCEVMSLISDKFNIRQ